MKFIELILATVALVAGVTAVFFSGIGFSSSPVPQEPSRHALLNPNPFALRGSAFGSLFSRLAEDDIDRVWHVGLEGEIHSAGNGWLARAREEKSRRTNPKPPGGAHATAIRRDLRQMLVNAFLLDPGSYTHIRGAVSFPYLNGRDRSGGRGATRRRALRIRDPLDLG